MAKTSYLQISVELEEKYYNTLQSMDRFIVPRMRNKTVIFSKKKLAGITARSFLPTISALWQNLTNEQKASWKSVDPHPQKHGYRTFVADQNQRIKAAISGMATPSYDHQNMAGKLLIEAPAGEMKLIQPHPSAYWLYQKITGTKNQFEAVEVSEDFALPLKIGISYKSNLISTGEGSFCHFYASIRHLYQGQNLNHDLIINIPLQQRWYTENKTVSELIGLPVSYNLYIHLYNVTGTLLIDNIIAEHSSNNWARDSFCNKIEQSFSRQWYQVPQNWGPITLPAGAGYQSIYAGDEEYIAPLYGWKRYGLDLYGEEQE